MMLLFTAGLLYLRYFLFLLILKRRIIYSLVLIPKHFLLPDPFKLVFAIIWVVWLFITKVAWTSRNAWVTAEGIIFDLLTVNRYIISRVTLWQIALAITFILAEERFALLLVLGIPHPVQVPNRVGFDRSERALTATTALERRDPPQGTVVIELVVRVRATLGLDVAANNP